MTETLDQKLDRLLMCALEPKQELPSPPKRYRLLSDGDGHDFTIAVGKEDAFQDWIDAGPYWEDYHGEDFSECVLGCSLSCYSFADFEEDR